MLANFFSKESATGTVTKKLEIVDRNSKNWKAKRTDFLLLYMRKCANVSAYRKK
jgi:hypothetical protein